MNKIPFFVLIAISSISIGLVSCGGGEEDGVIEEYYVTYTGTLLTIQANEVTEEHGGSHSHEKKPKKKKK